MKASINAIAPWFGGKRLMAPEIVRELGEHTQYFEPFCGGLSVLMCKGPSQKETVCDLHGHLINLARVISTPGLVEELYERLIRTMFCEALLEDARAWLENTPAVPDELDTETAYWYFLASWMGRNGTAGTARQDYQIAVRWTKNGGSPTVRFKNAVDSMPEWHRRLLNVVILRRDAFEIIPRFEDCEGTAIYCDGTYPPETRNGWENDGAGGRYLHEFVTHDTGGLFDEDRPPDDHERLATMLKEFNHARIVVSTYECDRYRDLYDGWTFLDKTRAKLLHQQNGRGPRRSDAPETLIINGPSYEEVA